MKKICKVFQIVLFLSVSIIAKGNNLGIYSFYANPFELKGKTVILSTYDGGNDYFPFVYKKDCFYTGKTSKKMKVDVNFLGVPIKIEDVQLANQGETSEKLCVLFSKDGEEYSVVIPLCVQYISRDMLIFCKMCYHIHIHHPYTNSPYTFNSEEIDFICYDYDIIKKIEDNYVGKKTQLQCNRVPKGAIFKRFIFKCDEEGIDLLYAEFLDNEITVSYKITPLNYSKIEYNVPIVSLEELQYKF